jgi:ribonuclease BN (tRNA processing enzyme)
VPRVRLTVVGCAGSHPGPDSACSAYLVEQDGFALLLDLGNGALGPLQKYLDPRDLDALYLSHLHGDHWLDLVPLAHVRRHDPAGPAPVLSVVAPAAERDRIAGAFGQPASSLDDVFAFREPSDGSIGPFDVRVIRTAHPVETHAIRLTARSLTTHGKSLVYTADTGPFASLAPFARGADLLLAEAGAREHIADPIHLTGTDAGQLARDAAVGRLVVTHVAPWDDAALAFEAAQTAFGGETTLARPGACYEL